MRWWLRLGKAYDNCVIRRFLAALGIIEVVISPRANRTEPTHYDAELMRLHNRRVNNVSLISKTTWVRRELE